MRFKHFKPTNLTEQQLDELRMNPRSLQQFAVSDEAKGIMAGFEAELVFTGLGGEADYDEDPEPDYDADERCRSIDDVINFFSNDEYGYATYGRDLDKLQEGLDEKYMEWVDEKMYDAFRDEQEDLIKKVDLEKIVKEGSKIYEKIKGKYEPKKNGKFLAIDIDSKDVYFAETGADAVELAKKSHPKKVFYVVKIGFEAAETMAQMFFAK